MTDIVIEGGRILRVGDVCEMSISISGGDIVSLGCETSVGRSLTLDAGGLLVLPGIVDIHGDAFERQWMPRPGVDFDVDIALLDSDRQAIANGITTVFHGATWSWEPGLRSGDNARKLLGSIESLRPQFAADTRFHLRHEIYNIDAEPEIETWLRDRRVDLLAFNDHMDLAGMEKPHKRARMIERTGLVAQEFDCLVQHVCSRGEDVPASIARLAAVARDVGVPMLSHDDKSVAMRRDYRDMGVAIAEFPINEATAVAAAAAGDYIVLGAPNVVRGGSHTGWTKASDMIAKGLCSILASDYYYPAPMLAAFRLVADRILPLPEAWALVSATPANAAGLIDRGELSPGRRADILLVDESVPLRPRLVAAIAHGEIVYLTEAARVKESRLPQRLAVAAVPSVSFVV